MTDQIDWEKVDKKVKKFTFEDEVKLAKCVHVYDGDTVHLVFPVQGILYRWSCRLSGVDTPELRTRNKQEKVYGYQVRDALREKLANKMVMVHCGEFDKYGRLLGQIYLKDDYEEQKGGNKDEQGVQGDSDDLQKNSINQWLIDNNYAFPYDGGSKKDWDDFLSNKKKDKSE
tara:strand:- start:39 stop:554 length:516 start_codon:yes stop_codon:yes gene_type:complete